MSAVHAPEADSLGHLNGPLPNEGGLYAEELAAAQETGQWGSVDHEGGPSYIAERLDVFSNMKKGKGGLLFSEEFILNIMNLVGQGPQLQSEFDSFLANFPLKDPATHKIKKKKGKF